MFAVQIIDPFVEVEIIGLPIDCNKQQTRVVDDNGKYKAELCKQNLAVEPTSVSRYFICVFFSGWLMATVCDNNYK